MLAYNWIDISNLIRWIVSLVMFIFPAVMFPLYWLNDDVADYLNAWYIISVLADGVPAFFLIMFVADLIIAAAAGIGNRCDVDDFDGDPYTCADYNRAYVDIGEAWVNWAIWTLLDGLAYFTLFWFGADAVRVVMPDGGYDLYYLYPNWIYNLLVTTGVAPKHSNKLDYLDFQQAVQANKAKNNETETVSNIEDFSTPDTTPAEIDGSALLATF